MVYVKVSETNAPYLDSLSLEPKDGYIEKEDLPYEQMETLFNFTQNCKLDSNGNIVVSNDKMMTDAEKENAQLNMQLKLMQSQFLNMMLALAKGGAK